MAIAVIAGVAVAGYWGSNFYRERADASVPVVAPVAPVRVGVQAVGKADIPITADGIGTVQGFKTVTIRSRVDGAIVEIAFKEGQDVKTGDLLFRIDPRPYKAALDQARAKLQQDQANLANLKLDLDRSQQLIARGAASRQQLDTQQAQVNIVLAMLEADRAAIEAAQTQLDYTTIRSPIDGRLGLRQVDAGNLVSASMQTPLVSIAQIKPIFVLFTLPESTLPKLREAMAKGPVPVRVSGRDTTRPLALGVVTSIDNQVDPTTGMFRLKSEIANEEGALWPGQFVNASVQMDMLRDRLAVPTAAVQRGPNGDFVYVVKSDDTVEARTIGLESQSEGMAMVGSGLRAGERIVLEGAFRLRPGMAVTPIQMRSRGTGRRSGDGSS